MGSPVIATLNMIKTLLLTFLLCSLAHPLPAEESEDRSLDLDSLEILHSGESSENIDDFGDLWEFGIGLIRNIIMDQLNAILGNTPTTTTTTTTTTASTASTTPCGGLLGGGLLCGK